MPYTTVITFVAYDTLAAADLNSNFSNLDYLNTKINSQIQVTAAAMKPSTTSGATPGEFETSSNTNNYATMDFADNGGFLFAEFNLVMPSDYAGGTVTAVFHWTANSTSTNSCYLGLQAVCIADDGALDVARGTAQYIQDANKSTAYDLNITGSTPAITIAGTPAAGKLCNFRVIRASSDGNDTLAATVRLLAVVITYTRS